MNKKISNRVNKILSFKKIVFVGFFAAFLAVFLSAGIVKAETTYKWVNNGSVLKSDSRKTGDCSTKKQVTTYTCSSSTKGNKIYDGANKGSSYGDIGNAWPIYEGENTSTATEYTYDGCSQDVHNTSGTVNEWECKSSDSTANSNSSSSSSNSSSSASSVSKPTVTTGATTNITSNSATISATINNGGASSAQAVIYYMKSNGSSWTLAGNKTLSGSGDQDISADITGLSSGTKYYYRAKAQNSAGVNFGSQKTFTTSSGSSSSVSSGASSSSSSVQQYTLKVKISGAGKITSSGGSSVINCKKSIDSKGKSETSGDCSIKFNKGESVTLTVSTPSTKYKFATWADACRGSQQLSSCTIVMNGDKTVSATFNTKGKTGENTVTVSVRKTGAGVGKVISVYSGGKNSGKEDGAINCGSNCSQNYKQYCDAGVDGDRRCGMAYFKAVAEKGSTFSGWGGDCLTFKNEKDQCYVILDGDKSINAGFNEGSNNAEGKYYDLTVTVSAGGTVATTDNKINCDSSNSPCKHSYGKNGTVTLKATPNSGYSFKPSISNWGSCDKMITGNNSCQIKMTKNRSVSVKFTKTSSSSSSKSTSSSSTSANHTATTGSVTNITSTSATLNGTVNPKGENVYSIFSYFKKGVSGTNKNTSWKSAGSGSSDVSVSADISGLSSGTTYYYWLSAYSYTNKTYVNSLNGEDGTAKTFTTSGSSFNSSSSVSSSSSSSSSSADGLTINKSGSGSGKVIIKTSSGAEIRTCDFTGSSSSCNYNPAGTDSVFLSVTVNSGSSFGGITNCSGGSNLTSDYTSGHCGVSMNNKSTVTVTFN